MVAQLTRPEIERLLVAAKAAYLMQGIADPRLAPVFDELGEAIHDYEACAEARPSTTRDGKYFFPLIGNRPCVDCGQPEGVQLQVGATGYSVGSGFQHTPECKQNFCPHGIGWSEDCGACDMARIEEGE